MSFSHEDQGLRGDGLGTDSQVVPEVAASSSANTYSSTGTGIDGYNDGTVEPTGTEQDWSNGASHYYA